MVKPVKNSGLEKHTVASSALWLDAFWEETKQNPHHLKEMYDVDTRLMRIS